MVVPQMLLLTASLKLSINEIVNLTITNQLYLYSTVRVLAEEWLWTNCGQLQPINPLSIKRDCYWTNGTVN